MEARRAYAHIRLGREVTDRDFDTTFDGLAAHDPHIVADADMRGLEVWVDVDAEDDADALKQTRDLLRGRLRLGCPFIIRGMEVQSPRPAHSGVEEDADVRRLLGRALHRGRLAAVTDGDRATAERMVASGLADWWTPLAGGEGIRLTDRGMEVARRTERPGREGREP